MEQMGYNQNDLANIVGLKSRASEILNRKETYIRNDSSTSREIEYSNRCSNSNILKRSSSAKAVLYNG
jgi:hypothetical protein